MKYFLCIYVTCFMLCFLSYNPESFLGIRCVLLIHVYFFCLCAFPVMFCSWFQIEYPIFNHSISVTCVICFLHHMSANCINVIVTSELSFHLPFNVDVFPSIHTEFVCTNMFIQPLCGVSTMQKKKKSKKRHALPSILNVTRAI